MIPVRNDHQEEDMKQALLYSEATLHQLIGMLSNCQQCRAILANVIQGEVAWNEETEQAYKQASENFGAYAIAIGEIMNKASEIMEDMSKETDKEIKKKMNTKIHTIH